MFSSQADLIKVYKNSKEKSKSTTRLVEMQLIQNQETKIKLTTNNVALWGTGRGRKEKTERRENHTYYLCSINYHMD